MTTLFHAALDFLVKSSIRAWKITHLQHSHWGPEHPDLEFPQSSSSPQIFLPLLIPTRPIVLKTMMAASRFKLFYSPIATVGW